MATKQKDTKNTQVDKNNLDDIIKANQFNFTTANINKVADMISQIDKAVTDFVKKDDNVKGPYYNANAQILDAIKATINDDTRRKSEMAERIKKASQSSGGIRAITEGLDTGNANEAALMEASREIIANAFAQFNEYKAVCSLIPEMGKVVKMFSRDILNVNDVTKNVFNSIFRKEDFTDATVYTEQVIENMNNEFIQKVITNNDLERKIRNYIKESLIKGCQPVSVIPYKQIIELITSAAENSRESIDQCMNRLYSTESMYLPKLSEIATSDIKAALRITNQSLEDINLEEFPTKANISVYENIINTSKAVEDYLKEEYDSFKYKLSDPFFERSLESGDKAELIELKKKMNQDATYATVKEKAKPLFMEFIDAVDNKVDIIDPSKNKNLLHLARKTIEKTLKFSKYNADDDGIKMKDFVRKPFDSDTHNANLPNRDKYNSNGTIRSTMDKYLNNQDLEKIKDINDVLITEYDPQMVVPFIVNGKHIGYWIIEEDAYLGDLAKAKRNNMTFTDIIKSLGMHDDETLASMGVPGVISGVVGGPDAVTGAALGVGLGSGPVGTGIALSSIGQNGESGKKIDMMKDLVVRTIANKIDSPDLANDKTFRDAMMNLIRDGFIIDKNIKITFIPEYYMVYFAYETDNIGLPRALFADTLLFCYLYISSTIQSLMIKMHKSASKETIEFNMSKNKNLGTSIRMIENALSTRTTHSWETFKNITNVIANSTVHDRLIIPIVDGEKLFNYEQMEKVNDLTIDDEYTQKLLQSILSVSPVPTSMLNKLEEDEYSRSIISQHINYCNGVIDCQSNYNKDINKLLKLIAKGTKFNNIYIKDNISNIDFKLTVPEKLSITNVNNSFGDIESYITTLVTYVFGPKAENENYAEDVAAFKYTLAQQLMQEIDWKTVEEIKDSVLKDHNERILNQRIIGKITAKNEEAAGDSSGLSAMGGGGAGGGGMGDEEGGEEGEGEDDMGMGDFDTGF